jgi:hypothetical protein
MGHHGDDLAAENLLVELERCLASAVKGQVRVHLHGTLLAQGLLDRGSLDRASLERGSLDSHWIIDALDH